MNKPINSYGIKRKARAENDIDWALEQLKLVGYTVVDSGYSPVEQDEFAVAFDRALKTQSNKYGDEFLREIDEHNTIRLPLLYEPVLQKLALNPRILAIAEHLIGGSHTTGTFILNQQNGIINPAQQDYNQGAYHRDLPYQHFTSSRPLAINALYCIDDFTKENGATLVIPGSHKTELFPSDETVRSLEHQVTAPKGSFLVLDCMVYHSGATNRSKINRRAVNHVYTIPIIRQQIDIPAVLGLNNKQPLEVQKLFGSGNLNASSIEEYYHYRRLRLRE